MNTSEEDAASEHNASEMDVDNDDRKENREINKDKRNSTDEGWKTSLIRNVHLKNPSRPPRLKKVPKYSEGRGEDSSDDDWLPGSSDVEADVPKQSKRRKRISCKILKKSQKLPQRKSRKVKSIRGSSSDDNRCNSSSSSEDEDQSGGEAKRNEVFLDSAKKSDLGSRKYDKRNSCVFCSKDMAKVGRHILSVHKSEPEVAEILGMEKKSFERKRKLTMLRQAGNFRHNLKVQKVGGVMNVSRRPNNPGNGSSREYLPCVNCLAFIKKDVLWRHRKRCPNLQTEVKGKRKIQCEASLLLHTTKNQTKFLEDVVSHMRLDDVTMLIKRDNAILRYGSFLYDTAGIPKRGYISQKMRVLSRLVSKLREITGFGDSYLESFLKPIYFDDVVKATRHVSTYIVTDAAPEMKTPSLALKIGYALDKVAGLEKGRALRTKDRDTIEDLDYFIHLMKTEWSTRISTIALNTLQENSYQKVEVLPLTEDLLVVRRHTSERMRELSIQLTNSPSNTQAWRELAETTVTRIVILNRRRSTEGAKLTIEQYQNRPKWSQHSLSEIQDTLTPLEMELCKR